MKKIIHLFSVVCVLGLFSACSSDDEDDDVARSSSVGGKSGTSGSTAVGGASSQTGGTSAVGGTSTETGGTQAVAGSSSAIGGTSSIAGSSSTTAGSSAVGGTSNVAGSSSTSISGSTSTGGNTSVGGVTSISPAVGLLSCALTRKGNEEYVSFVIKHHRETSSIKTVTFYGNCGVATTALSSWVPICLDVVCDSSGDCLCETFIQKGSYLQLNVDRGPYVWAVGSVTCPLATGCPNKEDLIQHGMTYIGDQLLDVPEAVRNPQGTGYNYLVQVL